MPYAVALYNWLISYGNIYKNVFCDIFEPRRSENRFRAWVKKKILPFSFKRSTCPQSCQRTISHGNPMNRWYFRDGSTDQVIIVNSKAREPFSCQPSWHKIAFIPTGSRSFTNSACQLTFKHREDMQAPQIRCVYICVCVQLQSKQLKLKSVYLWSFFCTAETFLYLWQDVSIKSYCKFLSHAYLEYFYMSCDNLVSFPQTVFTLCAILDYLYL